MVHKTFRIWSSCHSGALGFCRRQFGKAGRLSLGVIAGGALTMLVAGCANEPPKAVAAQAEDRPVIEEITGEPFLVANEQEVYAIGINRPGSRTVRLIKLAPPMKEQLQALLCRKDDAAIDQMSLPKLLAMASLPGDAGETRAFYPDILLASTNCPVVHDSGGMVCRLCSQPPPFLECCWQTIHGEQCQRYPL